MYVIKRNGKKEDVKIEKVMERVSKLSKGLKIEPILVAQKAINGLFTGIETREIDKFLAEIAASLATEHHDYSLLAGRIAVSSLHKETNSDFYHTMKEIYKAGDISDDFIRFVKAHGKELEKAIDYDKDFNLDYFGYKVLEKSYLKKVNDVIVERPQHLFMRVAVGIAGIATKDIKEVVELYEMLSDGLYTHATPTMFNAGTKIPQNSSCYLLGMDDSLRSIYSTLGDCADISKYAGGIGIHIHNIRSSGSKIRTDGKSDGIIPMLQVYNATARYVNQSGKRKGSIAVYLEPWHADIIEFIELRKNTGKEEFRARDLFTAIWANNLFFDRVEKNEDWSLFCPNDCPGLIDAIGDDFKTLYEKYEKEGKARKVVKAQEIWAKMIEAQIEGGTPYVANKDEVNKKSNQSNLGTIRSSNLCIEINEYSDDKESAVCNLASLCLPKFIKNGKFDFKELMRVTKVAIKNLNRVIDVNFYPTEKTKISNLRHRPLGLGIQGLANVFFLLDLPYDSNEARQLNIDIHEAIYFAAVQASMELAKEEGKYETFDGSPASKGILQFDMWGVKPSEKYAWDELKNDIIKFGMRNSLLLCGMPTASTSQIHGNIESHEAQTSNIYKRTVLSGEFVVINKHLIKKLESLGLWNKDIRAKMISANGSIQEIPEIDSHTKLVYRTVWEIKQKSIIDMSADRAAFICQSQSLNLFLANPTYEIVSSMLMYGAKKGLKTIMYYLRTKPAVEAQKISTENKIQEVDEAMAKLVCSINNPGSCEACGS